MELSDAEKLVEIIREGSDAFDQLTQERHKAGQEEYGAVTFLGNDVVRMMMEELADTANYCRMQFIKLMILQDRLESDLDVIKVTKGDDISFDPFNGTKKTGWGLDR